MNGDAKTYLLLGADGKPRLSTVPGLYGGYRRGKRYGTLTCPAALRAIANGGYVGHRVFFADEATAIAAGYRPCAVCLPDTYNVWKSQQEGHMTTANDRVTKLLDKLEAAWTEFRESYAGLSDEQLLEPGVTGEWSVRDTIAHVTWWEEEALKHLPLILEGGRPPRYSVTYGGIDAFNALMTTQRRDLSLADVRGQFEATHRRLVAYIESVSPEQVFGESRFRHRLRLDTYGHYPLHTKEIRQWRERRSLVR